MTVPYDEDHPEATPGPMPTPYWDSGGGTSEAGTEGQSQAEKSVSQAMSNAKEPDLIQRFLKLLETYGVPANSPAAQDMIAALGTLSEVPDMLLESMARDTATNYYQGALPYEQALFEAGFAGWEPPAPAWRGGHPPEGGVPYPSAYTEQPDTGWWKFNGVIVNPTDGTVIFDPTKSAPGSTKWFQKVQSSWDQEDISKWRKTLHSMGYLPSAKGQGWDVEFKNALYNYHIQRYLNGGSPISLKAPAGETEGGNPNFMNLGEFSASIRNDVRDQFVRVFGELPSEAELAEWTRFVIQQGNSMQRGKKGLTPDAAVGEAEAEMFEGIAYGPQGTFVNESVEENTSLQDAMARAVYAMRGLMA